MAGGRGRGVKVVDGKETAVGDGVGRAMLEEVRRMRETGRIIVVGFNWYKVGVSDCKMEISIDETRTEAGGLVAMMRLMGGTYV